MMDVRNQVFQPTTFGKYFLTRRIAVGGMAEVFHAKLYGADGFEKDIVIKQILPQHAREPEFVQSFVAEAKIAVTLNHANIVGIYELGRVDRTYFIAMEYIDGLDAFMLNQVALRYGERLGVGNALLIVEEVARGLDYAHRKQAPDGSPLGLVHRDLNPRNVLISREGEVKILDFGIAKTEGTIAAMPKTRAGVVKGTTGYMSPEQAMGREIDAKTDIYQAGLLLFELLTGQAMFWRPDDLETRDLMRKHRILPPSALVGDVTPELDQIVLDALARDPNERIGTAAALAARLAQYRLARFPETSHRSLGELVVRMADRAQSEEAEAERTPPTDQLFDTDTVHSVGDHAAPLIVTIAERELTSSDHTNGQKASARQTNRQDADQDAGARARLSRATNVHTKSLLPEAIHLAPGSTLADVLEPAPHRRPRRFVLAGALLVGLSAVTGVAAVVQRTRHDPAASIEKNERPPATDTPIRAAERVPLEVSGTPEGASLTHSGSQRPDDGLSPTSAIARRAHAVQDPPSESKDVPEALGRRSRSSARRPARATNRPSSASSAASSQSSPSPSPSPPSSPGTPGSSSVRERASATPRVSGQSATVSFGTKGCSGRVFMDGVLVARTLPTFNIEATAGAHVVKFEGTDCPRRERPDSLGSSIPVVVRRINLRPGEHLKLIADFEHGTTVVP
ncbi:MAG: serine/threonine protein kinase [Deltaproteobacteria bacterium]|nr:serine/threonine protein kinase [Deltaproteobacteria bacterium]